MEPFISQDFIDYKLFSFHMCGGGQFLYLLTQGRSEVNDLMEDTGQERSCRITSSLLLWVYCLLSGVMVNLHCQLDWIANHHGNLHLGIFVSSITWPGVPD